MSSSYCNWAIAKLKRRDICQNNRHRDKLAQFKSDWNIAGTKLINSQNIYLR